MYPLRPGEELCRDYLRTGRCKYGDACKYHHPSNVESGGGVRPTDPTEPRHPRRPAEPPCPYFLKHGTCKFGPACKFDHPARSPLALGDEDHCCLPAPHVNVNVMTTSASAQILPQRPTEPNCIYFLRNGKCKYGASCKFHHPLDATNRNHKMQHMLPTNARRYQNVAEDVHSAGSVSVGCPHYPQGFSYVTVANTEVQSQRLQPISERIKQPTHVLLPDGQIAVILDSQSLQNVHELNVQDRPNFYLSKTEGSLGTLKSVDQRNRASEMSPMLTATTTSTSNVTLDSSVDLMGTQVSCQRPAQGTPFRGPRESSSGGSLSAYGSFDSGLHMQGDSVQPISGQVHLPPRSPKLQLVDNSPYPGYAPATQTRVLANSGSGGSLSAYGSADSNSLTQANFGDHQQQGGAAYGDQTSVLQYSAWPIDGAEQVNQAQERGLLHSDANTFARESPVSKDFYVQPGTIHHPRHAHLSAPASKCNMSSQRHDTSEDDQGLSMMTSALLMMMDHTPAVDKESPLDPAPLHNINRYDRGYLSQIKPNLNEKASHLKSPPGMMRHQGLLSPNIHEDSTDTRSPLGGGYFVGGYDMSSFKSDVN